ncbi:MAG: hypothetical protein QM756_11010 [Polyangiaceae bacterium]
MKKLALSRFPFVSAASLLLARSANDAAQVLSSDAVAVSEEALTPSLSVVAASRDTVAGEHPIHQGAIGLGNEVLGSVQDEDGSEDAGRAQRQLPGSGNWRESANALEVAA